MLKIDKLKRKGGYIALSTVLITLALVMLIGLSASLLSINDLQSSLSGKRSNSSIDLVESCVEEVLLKLNEENTITAGPLSLPQGDCSVTINSQAGDTWDITISASLDGYTKSVNVNSSRSSTVTINNWQDS